jgi:hypothetical protein
LNGLQLATRNPELVTQPDAWARPFSRALHLDDFDQPAETLSRLDISKSTTRESARASPLNLFEQRAGRSFGVQRNVHENGSAQALRPAVGDVRR